MLKYDDIDKPIVLLLLLLLLLVLQNFPSSKYLQNHMSDQTLQGVKRSSLTSQIQHCPSLWGQVALWW